MPLFTDDELANFRDSVNLLAVALRSHGIIIPDEARNKAWRASLTHHAKHLAELRIKQSAVDPYKFVTWFAFDLAEFLPPERTSLRSLMRAAIATLDYCLTSENPPGGLDRITLSYLEDFTVNELAGQTDFGIGQNGLFVGFHTASLMKQRFSGTFHKGWQPEKN